MTSMNAEHRSPPEWHLDRNGPVATLRLSGDWIACDTGVRSVGQVRHLLDDAGAMTLRIDADALGKWDSALIAFLKMLRDSSGEGRARAVRLDDGGLPETARRLLALTAPAGTEAAQERVPHPSLVARVGDASFHALSKAVEISAVLGETMLRGAAALARRTQTRAIDVFELIRDAGAGALGIVAIVNGLIGAIMAFVGAIQFQRFGADLYVVNMVGIAVAREMAAIGTAVVMAGRTGGAYAAHLATMQGNDEIDALIVLGIGVFDFLVLPRVVALVTMMPLLYLYGCAVGLLGGLLASTATLDLSPALFLHQLRVAVGITQFEIGLAKSVVFGGLVALAACHIGLNAGRSAADVGHAATSAEVAGIVGIIAVDAVFAVCSNALGL